ncbi:MAG: hypothetical protein KatS3mg115_2062 [Candidatus Poribacteria bacterium]|nr:MAG: hypothetical protein KatS3mg115_2062 [Candidatus Poribacteria bacterium]
MVFEDLGLVYRIIRDLFTDEVDRMIIEGKSLYDRVMRYLDEIAAALEVSGSPLRPRAARV